MILQQTNNYKCLKQFSLIVVYLIIYIHTCYMIYLFNNSRVKLNTGLSCFKHLNPIQNLRTCIEYRFLDNYIQCLLSISEIHKLIIVNMILYILSCFVGILLLMIKKYNVNIISDRRYFIIELSRYVILTYIVNIITIVVVNYSFNIDKFTISGININEIMLNLSTFTVYGVGIMAIELTLIAYFIY